MEVSLNTYTIDIPTKDLSFFKEIIARMGWNLKKKNNEAVKAFSSSEEAQAIDFITSPWPDDGLSADNFVEMCESGRTAERDIIEI